ncbi:MAG: hypothetical protein QM788_05080 [Roseateles sp.]|uniref:hypothetical protein n=1 Tax=Roseateles sp. TaxID=1971397 RepID=UPI0039EA49A4
MKNTTGALALSLLMAAALSACGGGGGGDEASSGGTGNTGGSAGGTGGTTFPYARYDIYTLYGTATAAGTGAVTAVSATKGAVVIGSFGFRDALAGGETGITLGSDSVSLSSTIMKAGDLSWLAPGADGQLIQQCSVVRWDANGASIAGYAKSMQVMVAGTATALARITDIPAGTRLYVAEDCRFTGSATGATGDIAAVTPAANNHVVVNADGSLTVAPVGAASFAVAAADVGAALAAGGTGLDMARNAATGDTVPSTAGTGHYAMHAYSIPRKGGTPRYAIVVQATPPGGTTVSGREQGIVQMWVSP